MASAIAASGPGQVISSDDDRPLRQGHRERNFFSCRESHQLRRLLAKDDVLDDVTLYWLTNSAVSSARLYWENHGRSITNAAAQQTDQISVPVAVTATIGGTRAR